MPLKDDSFEIVLDSESKTVVLIDRGGGASSVVLQNSYVGSMCKTKHGKYVCTDLEGLKEFCGTTRREAATSMIYGCRKDWEEE